MLFDLCQGWPKAPVTPASFRPLNAKVPALILSGELDPATTVASAERLAAMLPRAKHIAFKATAHGPFVPACALDSAREFIVDPQAGLDEPDCSSLALSPFAVPAEK